jgi:hypothetical protein
MIIMGAVQGDSGGVEGLFPLPKGEVLLKKTAILIICIYIFS